MQKKITIIIVFILLISNNIYTQEFKAGINIGISTTQVSGDNLAGFHKAGIILGGFVNRNINQLLSLQLEMMFIQKGSSNTNKNNLIADVYLDYIEVPLLIKYRQSENISIESGIQNGTLAIAISVVLLDNIAFAIAPAVYSLIMFFTGGLVIYYGIRKSKIIKSN